VGNRLGQLTIPALVGATAGQAGVGAIIATVAVLLGVGAVAVGADRGVPWGNRDHEAAEEARVRDEAISAP
jgi:hypothetical protein